MNIEPSSKEHVKAVGGRIRALRLAKGIAQRRLGPMIGMTANACVQWEMGRSGLSVDAMHKLARVLGTTAEYLWTGRMESEEELAALRALRALPPDRRRAIITLIQSDISN